MYARVARFTGADAEALANNVAEIRERSGSGPPEGVPAKGFKLVGRRGQRDGDRDRLLRDRGGHAGDETLKLMSPPAGAMGTRASVDLCEVKVEVEAP